MESGLPCFTWLLTRWQRLCRTRWPLAGIYSGCGNEC
jgi:hypothetical protein